MEYDTVINQMMVYMAVWRIPLDNPFYAKLAQLAQEAYEYRAANRS